MPYYKQLSAVLNCSYKNNVLYWICNENVWETNDFRFFISLSIKCKCDLMPFFLQGFQCRHSHPLQGTLPFASASIMITEVNAMKYDKDACRVNSVKWIYMYTVISKTVTCIIFVLILWIQYCGCILKWCEFYVSLLSIHL